MKNTKSNQIKISAKSILAFSAIAVGCSFLSGCMDPTSLLLANSFFNQKTKDKPEPKLVCTDGVVHLEGNKSDTGIVGGKTLHKDSWLARGVVFITQEYYDSESDTNRKSMCTGILVDENMVLTAAHCVDKARTSYSYALKVYFTNQPQCDSKSGEITDDSRSVDALKIHSTWSDSGAFRTVRGDMALMRLSSKAPEGFYALKLTKEFVPMKSKVLLAGYGQTNVNYRGDYSLDNEGVLLRMGETNPLTLAMKTSLMDMLAKEMKQEENRVLSADEKKWLDNESTNETLFLDQTGGRGVCAGDSGGPSLMKNKNGMYVVTGVASFVLNPDRGANAGCGYTAAHTSVSYYKTWLDERYKEMKNYNSTKNSLFE